MFRSSIGKVVRAYQHHRSPLSSFISSRRSNFFQVRALGGIAIVEEVYNKWERRAPLTPSHVQTLVNRGIDVYVYPSTRRIFSDVEYKEAGAILTTDLSKASILLGVKQVPIERLIPDKTYIFFSHTIKAQHSNMALLDSILEKQIRLIDYECITDDGTRAGNRLVAFGKYAGMAGMIDILQGVGQKLLAWGTTSPFLNIPTTYQYPTLDDARVQVRNIGNIINSIGLPYPYTEFPLIFAFTGKGRVTQGAREIFELLPHKWVKLEELRELIENSANHYKPGRDNKFVYGVMVDEESIYRKKGTDEEFDKAEFREFPDRYECTFHQNVAPYTSVLVNGLYWDARYPRLITKEQIFELAKEAEKKQERLESTSDASSSALYPPMAFRPMMAISDITCDVEGSVEFLSDVTFIEKPYINYTPENRHGGKSSDNITEEGTLICGVDILPSELPREASKTFGDALLPLLSPLLDGDKKEAYNSLSTPLASLPLPLRGATITDKGSLTKDFQYIELLRREKSKETTSLSQQDAFSTKKANQNRGNIKDTTSATVVDNSMTNSVNSPYITQRIVIDGHIFDTRLINRILDLVESKGGSFHISDFMVKPNNKNRDDKRKSIAIMEIYASQSHQLMDILESIHNEALRTPDAEASVVELTQTSVSSEGNSVGNFANTSQSSITAVKKNALPKKTKKGIYADYKYSVLILGSGRVVGPAVEYLGRDPNTLVTIVGEPQNKEQIQQLASRAHAGRGIGLSFDVSGNEKSDELIENEKVLNELIEEHDVVISLLPAAMHAPIAEKCIISQTDMVTASYVSEQMQQLDSRAKEAGITILNEMGLDPGMDHFIAMKAIKEAKDSGLISQSGEGVVGFYSFCGGLAAPEALGTNPFMYKFSWSPRGVITAMQNSAIYQQNNTIVKVPGHRLLTEARSLGAEIWPTLRLEVLPNRDSTAYGTLYGIPDAQTCLRGTLRYEGWSNVMHGCLLVGLFKNHIPTANQTWRELISAALQDSCLQFGEQMSISSDNLENAMFNFLKDKVEDPTKAINAMKWLGILDDTKLRLPNAYGETMEDAICNLLEEKLAFNFDAKERDMVVMHHCLEYEIGNNMIEQVKGSLMSLGNEEDTAMARTVGITAALGAEMVLEGTFASSDSPYKGVVRPLDPIFVDTMLERLEKEDIVFEEETTYYERKDNEEGDKSIISG